MHKNDSGRVLGPYITEFCSNDSYIGIKRLVIDEVSYSDVDVNEMDKSNAAYYIVDTRDGAVMGPYTAEQYAMHLEQLHVGEMSDWIQTVPTPDGAVFGK